MKLAEKYAEKYARWRLSKSRGFNSWWDVFTASVLFLIALPGLIGPSVFPVLLSMVLMAALVYLDSKYLSLKYPGFEDTHL